MNAAVKLKRTAVIIPDDQPRFVRRMADDLAEHIRRMGGECAVAPTVPEGRWDAVVAAGQMTDEFADLAAEMRHDQAYALRVGGTRVPIVVALGAGAQGTKWALLDLLMLLDRSPDGLSLPSSLQILFAPKLPLRGVYAHLHWAYNHPYALRTWSLDDWKRYIDFLSYLRVNLLQLWPMASILPVPLSDGDRAYLEKYREVVQYARVERGMKVVVVETPNTVASGDLGVPIEKRDYFQAEAVKNPGDPDQMRQIRAGREQMYRAIPGADAYSIIDSDPGGWKGSPAEEFVDILLANRELLDSLGRRDAEIIYWMWQGWGTESQKENWRQVLEGMERRLPEPWGLFACNDDHLRLAESKGHLQRTVYFPYGLVEDEPSPPYTDIRFARIRENLNKLNSYAGIGGAMCNAQTPFVQLPNIHSFHRLAWDSDSGGSQPPSHDYLTDLGSTLFPTGPEALGEAWSLLSEDAQPEEMVAAAERLDSSLANGRPGRPGAAARFLPEDGLMVVRDLAAQLRVHAAARRARGLADGGAGREPVLGAIQEYLAAALKWQETHGYHGRADEEWGLVYAPDKEAAGPAVTALAGTDAAARLALAEELARSFDPKRRRMAARLAREITTGQA